MQEAAVPTIDVDAPFRDNQQKIDKLSALILGEVAESKRRLTSYALTSLLDLAKFRGMLDSGRIMAETLAETRKVKRDKKR